MENSLENKNEQNNIIKVEENELKTKDEKTNKKIKKNKKKQNNSKNGNFFLYKLYKILNFKFKNLIFLFF